MENTQPKNPIQEAFIALEMPELFTMDKSCNIYPEILIFEYVRISQKISHLSRRQRDRVQHIVHSNPQYLKVLEYLINKLNSQKDDTNVQVPETL